MECTGTDYDRLHCGVEKMGCEGCYYKPITKEKENEQSISKCSKNKSNKTN